MMDCKFFPAEHDGYQHCGEHGADRHPDDGPVWRDRGVIIAQLTARIGELELACQKLRDDYQGALARETALGGNVEALADEWDEHNEGSESWRVFGPHVVSVPHVVERLRSLAASPAEDTTPAAPHAEDGATNVSDVQFEEQRRLAAEEAGLVRVGTTDDGRGIYDEPTRAFKSPTQGGQA